MDKATARVAVLMGGMSSERKISLKTGKAVAGALRERGWEVVEIDVGRDLPQQLLASGATVAWIALHGRFGEDGCVQGLLEVMGIPYTGSGVRASAVSMDKIATKRALAAVPEVVFARDVVVRAGDPLPDLGLPVVVKSPTGGSTLGLSIAHSAADYAKAVADGLSEDTELLLEEYVAGDEITVAVLDGEALPVVRIVPESGFFDFEAKYTAGRTRYEVPAPIAPEIAERAQRAAVAAYRALGNQGLCRADFIVRASDGVPVFLEINTLPGMTATSLSPMAAGCVGMTFADLVERVLAGAHCMTPDAH